MRFVADFAARRRDRIGARRQRPRHRAQMIGGQRDRERGDQVDELAAGDPFLGLAVGDQRLDVLMAGLRRVGLHRLERQRGHVARLDEFGAQLVVARKAGELQQFVDIGRIVLGIEIERVARLVGRRPAVEGEREMNGFLVRARGIQVHVLADLGLDDIGVRRRRRLAEIDLDHLTVALAAVGIGRRENLQRVADPGRRRARRNRDRNRRARPRACRPARPAARRSSCRWRRIPHRPCRPAPARRIRRRRGAGRPRPSIRHRRAWRAPAARPRPRWRR